MVEVFAEQIRAAACRSARISAHAASDGQKVHLMVSAKNEASRSLVAGHVIFGEPVRGGAGDGEIDEGDDRERLRRGIIDGDLVGRAKMLEHQHVGVGEQKIEALDQKDGNAVASQALMSYVWAFRHFALEAAVEHDICPSVTIQVVARRPHAGDRMRRRPDE